LLASLEACKLRGTRHRRNGVLSFEKGVLAFENEVLAFENGVLAFENEF
jgi:hypothetical protein